nr:transposase [Micromonospora veneta]
MVIAETRRRFDREFREGAVRIVRGTGKPIAQVARDLGTNDGTLANWVAQDRRARGEAAVGGLGEDECAELARLRKGRHRPRRPPHQALRLPRRHAPDCQCHSATCRPPCTSAPQSQVQRPHHQRCHR